MKELSTFVLENGALSVIISPVGAELQSVVCGGVERMWSGDPAVWGRRAPLLFPLIGRLRDGWYANGGRRVDAPMHGFCRDRLFAAEQESGARVRFETASDRQTRAVYPFDFRLTVDFSLEGSSIVKSHTVENLGDVPMPFELGGHEAYATRLMPGERMVDCFVRFEDIDKLEMFGMDEAGILTLGSSKSGYEVTVEFSDFPYLGIWTKAGQDDARYLCIEPWSALPDARFSPRELSEKPGVRTLAPGERAVLEYRMTFR